MIWRRRWTDRRDADANQTSDDDDESIKDHKKTNKALPATVLALSVYSLILTFIVCWHLQATPKQGYLGPDSQGIIGRPWRSMQRPPSPPDKWQSAQQRPSPADNLLLVRAKGPFLERVREFNVFLEQLRADRLQFVLFQPWQPVNEIQWLLRGCQDDYINRLTTQYNVMTVALPWLWTATENDSWSSFDDTSNVLIQSYHEWSTDHTLCTCIERRPYKVGNNYDAVYNRTCNRNITDTKRAISLRPVFLNGKPIIRGHYWPNNGTAYPPWFYTAVPPYVFFMHVYRHAIVTKHGDVASGNVKLVTYDCSEDLKPLTGVDDSVPLYDEVFVIAQKWAERVFHKMAEIVPRLILFLDFLKNNPQIRLFALERSGRLDELLLILGLDPGRLLTGEFVRAKVVYQPRATGCGYARVQESQALTQFYHDYIRQSFPAQPRNRVIMIRRSEGRVFLEQEEVEKAVERAAGDFNLEYTVFVDNPTPSLNNTMIMFHSAVMVVAPHGAGLSNLYFSQPGTYVVEGVCEVRIVNLCFQWLAHILGHHWHGVTSRGGCPEVIDIPPVEIEQAVRTYLQLWVDTRP